MRRSKSKPNRIGLLSIRSAELGVLQEIENRLVEQQKERLRKSHEDTAANANRENQLRRSHLLTKVAIGISVVSICIQLVALSGSMTTSGRSIFGNEHVVVAGQDYTAIADNISTSITEFPGVLTGTSYMLGILIGILGLMKTTDYVENPGQTPLQHGAIRLTRSWIET